MWRVVLVLLSLALACTSEVADEPECTYEIEKSLELLPLQSSQSVYARCNDGDPVIDGGCEGGTEIRMNKPEQLNDGTGHWYCAFWGPGTGVAHATCSCDKREPAPTVR